MSLSGALYTGLSGLTVNQTQMNVVGNNIANVNTVAFKSSRAIFTPQFYVTDQPGSAPDANYGGTNPSQTGLGAQVAAIEKSFTQGTIQPTGNTNDMAINGNGFFITQDSGSGQQYTRDGAFTLNANDELVTSTGAFVQGYGATNDGTIIPGTLQNLKIPLGSATIAKATTTASLTGNLASDGTVANGATVLDTQDLTTAGATLPPTAATALDQLVNASNGTAAFTDGQTLNFTPQRDGSTLPTQTFTVSATTTVVTCRRFSTTRWELTPPSRVRAPASWAARRSTASTCASLETPAPTMRSTSPAEALPTPRATPR